MSDQEHFKMSAGSNASTLLEARLKVRLARLQLERDSRERQHSLEAKRLEMDSKKMDYEYRLALLDREITLKELEIRKMELEHSLVNAALILFQNQAQLCREMETCH